MLNTKAFRMRKLIRLNIFAWFVTLLMFFLPSTNAKSQAGMRFPELAKRLEPYYDADLVDDIKKQLPQGTDYSIWGWDVGDFSGDNNNDVALTIKLAGEKNKMAQVFLFVDIDGFLTRVAQFSYEYVEMPLEIGIIIRYNTCYVTKKFKQFNWVIRGFKFENGSLIFLDEFSTEKLSHYTHEKYVNYQSLQNTEKYINTTTGEKKFFADFLTIPSYYRSRQIYKGYAPFTLSDNIDYVQKGAYWWKGANDCSFTVKSSFDERYLYMTIKVIDDVITTPLCDTCPCDYVELWFDNVPRDVQGDRFIKMTGKNISFRKMTDKGLFSFKIYPGDFREKKAFLKNVTTTDALFDFQKEAINRIKAVASLENGAYIIKFKIPFLVFGYESPPLKDNAYSEYGCTIIAHDIDNEFRPEEETEIASSVFNSSDPSSYGSLLLVPQDMWYGNTINIYRDEVLKYLIEYGF
jgi:hypothetical protein